MRGQRKTRKQWAELNILRKRKGYIRQNIYLFFISTGIFYSLVCFSIYVKIEVIILMQLISQTWIKTLDEDF
jgi:hypothetical protein